MDSMTPKQGSRYIAAVTGKDTNSEMIVMKYLFSRGLRYRLHDKKLPDSPDICFEDTYKKRKDWIGIHLFNVLE